MDKLNLWNDDPEEVLFDLGFGCDEPDLSCRIPTRFINYQSHARGINLQVFLEAQKSRLDLENPDVSNRFRQLEVLQQVTIAFSSLVESSSSRLKAKPAKDLTPEAQERRKRMGILLRRASNKSLSQIQNDKNASESLQPTDSLREKIVSSGFVRRKKSPGQARESFEMEEINSFDENGVKGSYTGSGENFVQSVIWTNGCQSDSSGFLEESFIPSISQPVSPGPDHSKALSDLPEGNIDSQRREGTGSSPFSSYISPFPLISLCQTSSAGDKYLPSSPCPSPLIVFGPSHSPALLGLPKFDLQISNTETLPDLEQSLPSSLSALPREYLPPCCSSTKLQSITHSKSPSYPSPASCTSVSLTSSNIKNVNTNANFTNLSTPVHDSEGTTCFTFSGVPPPVSYYSPSPDLNCQFYESTTRFSAQLDSSESPWNIDPEWTEVSLHENLISASVCLSFLFPSSPDLPPSAIPDFHFPTSIASSPFIKSISHSVENDQNDSVFLNSDGRGLSDSPIEAPKEHDEKPFSVSFHLDMDSLTAPSPLGPCCQPALFSQSYESDGLFDSTIGRILGLMEQSITQQHRTLLFQDKHEDKTHSPQVYPIQDVIHVKMDHISLDSGPWTHSDVRLQRTGRQEGESERHTCSVQNQAAVVYISDMESSASLSEDSLRVNQKICSLTEIDPCVPSCSLHDELLANTKQEDFGKVCEMKNNGTPSELLKSYIVLHGQVLDACSKPEVKPNDLIEGLDLAFETSVDSSDCENADMEAFFQQLDTEGQVFWAEPIQVSNPSPVDEESGNFEISDRYHRNSLMPRGAAALDSFSSTGKSMSLSSSTTIDTDQTSRMKMAPSLILASVPSLSMTQHFQPSNGSVSVQMPFLSSHIAHRKDVPFITESKHSIFSGNLPLDTSTPFRAVQSWTDLHIKQNALTKKLSHVAHHTGPNKVTNSMSTPQTTYRPTVIFSVSPSFPLLPESQDSIPNMAGNCETVSACVDTGLLAGEPHEVNKNGKEDEEKLWENNHTATMTCCCAWDPHRAFCTHKSYDKQHTTGNIPYSLDKLEEMMLCLQHFRSVLSNMELHLSEDQAAVYSALSDMDRCICRREKVQDIQELRRAVKQQAGELELRLHELAHQYDDSLKLKMHRLLDEQSLLCSQLRVFIPGIVPTSLSPAFNRTVATQCCLLPWLPMQRGPVSAKNMDFSTKSPPGSENIYEGQGGSPTKTDKLNIVGFLQRLKESFHHSVNTDLIE